MTILEGDGELDNELIDVGDTLTDPDTLLLTTPDTVALPVDETDTELVELWESDTALVTDGDKLLCTLNVVFGDAEIEGHDETDVEEDINALALPAFDKEADILFDWDEVAERLTVVDGLADIEEVKETTPVYAVSYTHLTLPTNREV